MAVIRLKESTWNELNRVAKEFIDLKRLGFENVLKISPDQTIQRLIDDWDNTDKADIQIVEQQIRDGTWGKHPKTTKSKEGGK